MLNIDGLFYYFVKFLVKVHSFEGAGSRVHSFLLPQAQALGLLEKPPYAVCPVHTNVFTTVAFMVFISRME